MLSQTVGYAIAALGHLSRYQKQLGAQFVRDIAKRGTSGGVSLARPAEEVTLFEVCEVFDDPIVQKRCMLGTAACTDERNCPAHCFWTEERERVAEFLRRTTLAEIARFEEHKTPILPVNLKR